MSARLDDVFPEVADLDVSAVSDVQANGHAALRETAPETAAVSAVSPIPDDTERPCFRVLDDWTEHDGKKLRPGVWHFGMKAGKGDAPPALTQSWVCSPLYSDAVTTDGHEGNFGRLLRFRTTLGKWRTWAMPMELLRADGNDLRGELLAMGVEIDPSARLALAQYLQTAPRIGASAAHCKPGGRLKRFSCCPMR